MNHIHYQADSAATLAFLENGIQQNANVEGQKWLTEKLAQYKATGATRDFYLAFSAAARFVGKQPIRLDLTQADRIRSGFRPHNWTLDQAARVWLVLHLPIEPKTAYLETLQLLFETGDVREQVALYSALPVLPQPEWWKARAAEGIRTNITQVFDAIALYNPYPAQYLDTPAWNQLVLKAIFTGRPLYQIQGIDLRANAELALILHDYAHERWAAGRTVTPELWRCTAPFLNDSLLADLKQVLEAGTLLEQEAAMLTCLEAGSPASLQLAHLFPDIHQRVAGALTWEHIGKQNAEKSN